MLVPATVRLLDAALVGDDSLATALGYPVEPGWATFTEALQPTRDILVAEPEWEVWGPRMFLDGDPPRLVLVELWPDLVHHAALNLSSEDVLGFLGRKLHPSLAAEVVTDTKHRPEGWRVRHRMGSQLGEGL